MQNNDNQTNQKDPHNRGQNGFEHISPGLCSIWLGMRDSNPRMPGPEPGALPLGESPLGLPYDYTLNRGMAQAPSSTWIIHPALKPTAMMPQPRSATSKPSRQRGMSISRARQYPAASKMMTVRIQL